MQCSSDFFLNPCKAFFSIHNIKEFHMSTTHLHEEPSPFAGLEPSSWLFVLSSCIGMGSKKLVHTYLLYVAKDFVDLYYMPLRCLFSRVKSPNQLSYSSYWRSSCFWLSLLAFYEPFMSFCRWGDHKWTQYSRHGQNMDLYCSMIFSVLFSILLLIIPNICFALSTAIEH